MSNSKAASKQNDRRKHEAEWERILSSEQWAKGRLIANWVASRANATPERFARDFGGITVDEVRRLLRVHSRFYYTRHRWPGLLWGHFWQALEWSDADHWLKIASDMRWDPEQMRLQRWEAK